MMAEMLSKDCNKPGAGALLLVPLHDVLDRAHIEAGPSRGDHDLARYDHPIGRGQGVGRERQIEKMKPNSTRFLGSEPVDVVHENELGRGVYRIDDPDEQRVRPQVRQEQRVDDPDHVGPDVPEHH